jgi:hypothetical protein
MYYICKVFGTWTLFDGLKNTNRLLETQDVDCLKHLFPGLVGDSSKILLALQINAISPNRLQQLTTTEKLPGAKKPREAPGKL